MSPYNQDLAIQIINDDDIHQEHPDSCDTMEALMRTVVDIQYEQTINMGVTIKNENW